MSNILDYIMIEFVNYLDRTGTLFPSMIVSQSPIYIPTCQVDSSGIGTVPPRVI